MPNRRFIKLPDGSTVPIVEGNGKILPELSKNIQSNENISEETPEISEEIVNENEPKFALPESEDDMEDLSDMFTSSLDRDIVNQGIHDVSTVTEEEVMGEDEEPIGSEPMQDLFEVSDEDVMGGDMEDLVAPEEPENLDDLTEVSEEDIIGEPEKQPEETEIVEQSINQPSMETIMQPRKAIRRFKRTSRPYMPPPSTLGGIRS